jgi:hypothetical protein
MFATAQVTMATRRGQDFRIDYDADDGGAYTAVQRTYEDSTSGARLTPITQLFLDRVTTGTPIALGRRSPRHCVACILNPGNAGGISQMTAISPYRPTDSRLAAHLREILAYASGPFSVETITYYSEGY